MKDKELAEKLNRIIFLLEKLVGRKETIPWGGDFASLSKRQRQVLLLYSKNLSTKDIGLELHITESTAGGHLYAICRKLGLHGYDHLSRFLYEKGCELAISICEKGEEG